MKIKAITAMTTQILPLSVKNDSKFNSLSIAYKYDKCYQCVQVEYFA